MDVKLYAVRVFVSDWERSLRFYSDVLGIPAKFVDAELGWAELGTHGASLALEFIPPDDPEAGDLIGRFVGVTLAVSDVDALYESLKAHGVEAEAPEKQNWGGTLLQVKDPDGNILTFLS